MQLKYQVKPKAILLLQDGKVFEGKAAGKIGTTTGEICFNTGMTGYQEIFTDPSYFGQIIVMANTHIGNYGVQKDEVESDSVKISGMICKKLNNGYSRKRADGSLQDYFTDAGIVAISDIDTRALVRYIRDKGAMNCIISSDNYDVASLKAQLDKVPSMEGLELSSKVSTKQAYEVTNENPAYRVALMDFGAKKNIIRSLVERGCHVKVFPMKTKLEELMAFKPDGFMMSNGPGDPGVMKEEIALVKSIIDTNIPVFGICLGHQLIAESQGISTYKMHAGHRGINHPVKNLITGKSEITSQNHGFSVKAEDVKNNTNIEITHMNLNDNTIEGIRMKDKKVFCVQYHPESNPGPYDSRYLFDDFVKNMGKN
ncbi:MAG: glutamine-hydrolyzing carbamoyl-phosphate synthase small subunit [Bacteroidota bacterium]|nr:glutamine-hydrolyzing carbamoyl-phosphate synthase small subunit [Bacteroidota bacterium]